MPPAIANAIFAVTGDAVQSFGYRVDCWPGYSIFKSAEDAKAKRRQYSGTASEADKVIG